MTVLMREKSNDADLAWAAADPSVAGVMGQLLRARQIAGTDLPQDAHHAHDPMLVEPELLRAWGAL